MLGVNPAQGQSSKILTGCQSILYLGSQCWNVIMGDTGAQRSLATEGKSLERLVALALAVAFYAHLHSVKQITQKIRSSFFGRI